MGLSALIGWDKQALFWLNGCHHPWLDVFFLHVTDRYFWIPAYLILSIYLYVKNGRAFLWLLPFIALTILCSDQVSASMIKPWIQRLRPCHDPDVAPRLHLLDGVCGGSFGFVSSHAANTFALAALFYQVLQKPWNRLSMLLFVWAGLLSYSRIYLGVHYPGDVLGGMTIGLIIGTLFGYLYRMRFGTLRSDWTSVKHS